MPQRFIHPPRVTPGVNLPRYYTPTLRLLLSPLLYFFSSRRSLSGFSRVRLCLCLSICVFICLTHIHLKVILLSWMHRLSRQWEEIIPLTFKTILGKHSETHNILHMLDYSGVKTQSKVKSYWQWCILRKHLSLQGLPPDLRRILAQWKRKVCVKKKKSGNMAQLSNDINSL